MRITFVEPVTATMASSIPMKGNDALPSLNLNDAAALVATARWLSVMLPATTLIAVIVVLTAMPAPLTTIPTVRSDVLTPVAENDPFVIAAVRLEATLST